MRLDDFAWCIGCTQMTAATWYAPMTLAMAEFEVNNTVRVAQFLAQVGHESMSLSDVEENLNYSAQRLMRVWPKRFPSIEKARYYEHAPERLANFVYGGRMGNGAYESGDGWRYHGRGPIQLTGGENYRKCGRALNLALVEQPDLLLEPKHGSRAAAWYFREHGCNEVADDVEECTQRINGGAHGLDDRRERYARAMTRLGA